MTADLPGLIERIRTSPGVRGKSAIGMVSEIFQSTDWLAGPGDDGAVVRDGGLSLVVGGEAILPSFVAADPPAAGIAPLTPNLNPPPPSAPCPPTLLAPPPPPNPLAT